MTPANDQPKDTIPAEDHRLPPDWAEVLAHEFTQPYWVNLQRFVATERAEHEVCPAPQDVFAAFRATPFEGVRVVTRTSTARRSAWPSP